MKNGCCWERKEKHTVLVFAADQIGDAHNFTDVLGKQIQMTPLSGLKWTLVTSSQIKYMSSDVDPLKIPFISYCTPPRLVSASATENLLFYKINL